MIRKLDPKFRVFAELSNLLEPGITIEGDHPDYPLVEGAFEKLCVAVNMNQYDVRYMIPTNMFEYSTFSGRVYCPFLTPVGVELVRTARALVDLFDANYNEG